MKINFGASIEKSIWGFFVGVIVGLIIYGLQVLARWESLLLSESGFWFMLLIVMAAFALWGAVSTPRQYPEFISDEGLTRREKINAFLLSLTYYGALFENSKYYKLRKQYPVKAQQLNRIVWSALFVEFIVLIGLALFLEWVIPQFFGQDVYRAFLRLLG